MEEEISGEISLDVEHNYKEVQKTIAKRLLNIHGDRAYMLALLEMEDGDPRRRENWREILNLMEQLEKEQKDASS